jgi:hypothetical protein
MEWLAPVRQVIWEEENVYNTTFEKSNAKMQLLKKVVLIIILFSISL